MKKNTEKKLAVLLAGSLVTCALGTDVASAATTNDNSITNISSKASNEIVADVPIQTFTFDKANPKNLVINNVTFGNETLKSFTINKQEIDTSDFIIGTNSITIPYKHLMDLNLEPGTYSTSIELTNNNLFVNCFVINLTDSTPVVTPPVEDNNNQDNNDQDNDNQDKNDKDEVVLKPTIPTQSLICEKDSLKDLTIKNVEFNGYKLNFLYINDTLIPASDLVIGADTITIPVKVLESLNTIAGNYTVSLKFEDGTVLDNVALSFKDSSVNDVIPDDNNTNNPTDKDDTNVDNSVDKDNSDVDNFGDTVDKNYVFDKNNPTAIEIPNFIPAGTTVESITINNKEVSVVYPMLRTLSDLPVVYVYDDKIVVPAETLEYVGLENENYEISLTLDDGQTITKTISVDVVDSSNNTENPVTPPSTDNNNSTTTNTSSTTATNTTVTNNSTSKVESVNSSTSYTKEEKATSSTLPKTGAAATTGLVGSLLAAVTGIFATRKKK